MKVISIYFFTLMLVLNLSCNNKSYENQYSKSRTLKFDDTLKISLLFGNLEMAKEMPRISNKHDSLQDLRCPLNHNDWQNLISYFRQFTKDETDPWYFEIYLDKYCKMKDSIKFEDIAGFQVWTIKPNNKIYFRFFVADNKTLIERTQFNCEALYWSEREEDYFINYELKFKNASPKNNTKIIFYSDSLKEHHPDKYNHDFLSRRIEKYGKKKI